MAASTLIGDSQLAGPAEKTDKEKASLTVRRTRADDWEALARLLFDAFVTFDKSVGIPPHMDFGSLEESGWVMKAYTSDPDTYGVAAMDGISGALMGGGFLHPGGDVYSVGPIFVNHNLQGRGVGKALMVAIVEKAKSENAKSIRLCQVAANKVSFSLYATLGFVPVECWTELEGSVTPEQAATASHLVGFSTLADVEVWKMKETDITECSNLFLNAMGYDRCKDIKVSESSWVVAQGGNIIGYTSGFNLQGHAVTKTEEALVFLYTEVCRNTTAGPAPTLHLAVRLYPRLLQWAMAAKLKVTRHLWYMVIGWWQSPQDGMVWCPGIEH